MYCLQLTLSSFWHISLIQLIIHSAQRHLPYSWKARTTRTSYKSSYFLFTGGNCSQKTLMNPLKKVLVDEVFKILIPIECTNVRRVSFNWRQMQYDCLFKGHYSHRKWKENNSFRWVTICDHSCTYYTRKLLPHERES